MIYQVYEITGQIATDAESGQALYDRIHPELIQGNSVELDFNGVAIFASAFFNFAIGQLLADLSPETLNMLLRFTNLNDDGQMILARVIENAKRYYSDDTYRKAVDSALEEYAASF